MNFSTIDLTFFAYMFLGLYMTLVLVLIFFRNRDKLFEYPVAKLEPVSIVMPCYNEEETIGKAIESLLDLDYPKEMLEIIIVDDCSKDNSVSVAKEYAKKYKNVRVIVNSRNSGGAAEPTNIGIKAAKYNYIAVADSDSTPMRDALKKMLGFLQNDEKVGGVTCAVLVKNPVKFIQKLQAIEYAIIAYGRKLLDFIDAVYVTPGPFALYKKRVLVEIGLFDTKNMTQDIEIVWRMLSKGYYARMCLATRVYSVSPDNLKTWFKQRIRWTIGGNQTLWKYRKFVFKQGMLGFFIIPFFALSLFLGLFGLALYAYLVTRNLIVGYLSTSYSLYAQSTIFRFSEISFTPSVLNFFGAALFFVGIYYTFFGLSIVSIDKKERGNVLNILFYSLVYLTLYPVMIIIAIYKQIRGKYSW